MKNIIACICEGGAESFIINKLLDGELIRERSAKGFEGKIELYIIHDNPKENFQLSKLYREKVEVKHIITYPEI